MSDQAPLPESPRMSRRSLLKASGIFAGGVVVGGAAWEGLRGPVLGLFGSATTPQVITPHWQTYTSLSNQGPAPSHIPWVSFEGDPAAGADQKTWRLGGVVGTPSEAFRTMLKATPGNIPAAAFRLSDTEFKVTQLGSFGSLGQVERDKIQYASVIFMIGHGALDAALGFLDQDGNFIGSPDAKGLARTDIYHRSGDLADVPVLKG